MNRNAAYAAYLRDLSPAARSVPPELEFINGRDTADKQWEIIAQYGAESPLRRTDSADRVVDFSEYILGVEVTAEERRGFTERWNELQASL